MGVKRGRRRVGGVVITCGSRAGREGSPRSRVRAVGHEIGFRAQRSDYPYSSHATLGVTVFQFGSGFDLHYSVHPRYPCLWTEDVNDSRNSGVPGCCFNNVLERGLYKTLLWQPLAIPSPYASCVDGDSHL